MVARVGTDVIDLCHQHRVDPDVPIEDVASLNSLAQRVGVHGDRYNPAHMRMVNK